MTRHEPVLLSEVVSLTEPAPGEILLDCTVNRGGHARALCDYLGPAGQVIGLDADAQAIREAGPILVACPGAVRLMVKNFRWLGRALDELGVRRVDIALFDLGLSAEQLAGGGRGFSFQRDEPLQMTFAAHADAGQLTAAEIVNHWREETLADTIFRYGEERFARRIAVAIVAARARAPLETTAALVAVIESAVPFWYARGRLHPATRTFQALRIAVNDELGAIAVGLEQAWSALAPGGRLAVITFHSLEARLVKEKFKEWLAAKQGQKVTAHAVRPTYDEIRRNPRARSAQLRVIRKLA